MLISTRLNNLKVGDRESDANMRKVAQLRLQAQCNVRHAVFQRLHAAAKQLAEGALGQTVRDGH